MDYTKLKQEQDTLYQKASAYQKNDINYSQQLDENAAVAINLNKQLNNTLQNLDDTTYNLQSVKLTQKNALNDYNKFITRKVNVLDNQLNQFRDIEGDISTRDRLVQINRDYYEKQQKIVSTLIASFIIFLVLIRTVTFYMSGTISLTTFSLILFITLILYLIFLIYYLNILGSKTLTDATIQDVEILARDVKNGVYIVRQDVEKGLFGAKHCPSCDKPNGSGSGTGKDNIADILDNGTGSTGNNVVRNKNSFIYYDGSQPPQSIIPWNKSNCHPGVPPPKWTLNPNQCLPGSKKTDVPKPAFSDTDQNNCIPMW